MKLAFVFTDDWEVRGDGTGDVLRLMVGPAWRLMDIFERHGMRYTIMAEVMHYRRMQAHLPKHPEFALPCDMWRRTLEAAILRGHDVQLHLHPQWVDAVYEAGSWKLGDNWSLPLCPEAQIREMVTTGKPLLEKLLQPLNAAYRCRCFRSGTWPMNPSQPLVDILLECGIDTDVSVAPGVLSTRERAPVDYREVDEAFAPYFADPQDVRHLASQTTGQRFLEIPTQTRRVNLSWRFEELSRKVRGKIEGLNDNNSPSSIKSKPIQPATNKATACSDSGLLKTVRNKLRTVQDILIEDRVVIFDLSLTTLFEMRWITEQIFEEAERRFGGLETTLPVVVNHHSKSVQDFEAIDAFLSWLNETYADRIENWTLAEAAERLHAMPALPWQI